MRKYLNIRETPSCWYRNLTEEKCPTPSIVQNIYPWLCPLNQTNQVRWEDFWLLREGKDPRDGHNAFVKYPQNPHYENSDMYIDPLEKHLYEEPEDIENKDNNGNLQGIEEEIDKNY